MANNRLYIVNTETKEYACIAKGYNEGWMLGNVEILKLLLKSTYDGSGNVLLIGDDNDDEFYNRYIAEGVNVNTDNAWEYL